MKSQKASKTAMVSLRLTQRDVFCLHLIARKRGVSITALAESAVTQMVSEDEFSKRPREIGFCEVDGITKQIEILHDSMLDSIWSPNPAKRLFNLFKYAGHLVTEFDTVIYKQIHKMSEFWFDTNVPNFLVIQAAWDLLEDYADDVLNNNEVEFDHSALRKIIVDAN